MSGEEDDAGGLSPGKEDNEARRKIYRNLSTIWREISIRYAVQIPGKPKPLL